MQRKWSKVKKNLESFICEALKDRVNFFVVNYKKAHDGLGRAYITVDKKEILSMCTYIAEGKQNIKYNELRFSDANYNMDNYDENRRISDEAHELLKKEGIFGQYDFFNALEIYFSASIEQSLNSDNMLIKIFALIDKRTGKRTLEKLKDLIKNESELVNYFYKLRCEAEGII
ncbi:MULTISPECIES: hypothetical protein [unclassified Clostridium]|uniref:SF0329 family protein n=1 Tax=unclassified Clostridium TaxID=2614128 RepID=UPI0013E96F95|nr:MULTISPECIES: hypothetical protein [unclassified Clostridium]MBZ9622161.1 hypothetical protein [Clostridium sp. FP2]MBZ9633729.1 hypothetical protein [Clostridium sp. FP1]